MVKRLTAKPDLSYDEKMSWLRFLFAQVLILTLFGSPAVARYGSRAADEALAADPTALFIYNLFGIAVAIFGIFSLAKMYGHKKKGAVKEGLSFVPTYSQLDKAADQLTLTWRPQAASKVVSCLALVMLFPLVWMIPLGFLVMDGRDLLMSWLMILTGLIALVPCWKAFSVVFVPKVGHQVTFDRVQRRVTYTRKRCFFTTFYEMTGPDVALRVQSYYDPMVETSPPRYGVVVTFEDGREMVLDCFPSESEARSLLDELEAFAAGMRSQ